MYKLIENYIINMTKEDINNFAIKNDIILNNIELDFIYKYIKNNYQYLLNDPDSFNIDSYEKYFQKDNFIKIKKVFIEYFSKYRKFL